MLSYAHTCTGSKMLFFRRKKSNNSIVNKRVETSDVPESFLSSQSHEPFESESSEILPSRVRVES